MDERLSQLPIKSFVRDRLSVLLKRLDKEWRKCADSSDADAVHDFRVALRRFGEALRLFQNLMAKRGCKQVRAERRQIMQLAGQTRDVDIARETFVYSDAVIPPELDRFLLNERATAEAALRAALAVGLATEFSRRWAQTLGLNENGTLEITGIAEPASIGKHEPWHLEETATANAKQVLPGLLEDYCGEGQKLAVEDVKVARLHGLRLRGKHLRYALEVFRPVYGQRMDDLLDSLKGSQTDLGEISDCTATISWLKEKKIIQSAEGQHLKSYLEYRAAKGARQFTVFWSDHWGLPAFREHWIRYLAVYAGRVPPKLRVKAAAAETAEPDS
jgi:CHAD domain-containing protein